jgi:hypothetical protein
LKEVGISDALRESLLGLRNPRVWRSFLWFDPNYGQMSGSGLGASTIFPFGLLQNLTEAKKQISI